MDTRSKLVRFLKFWILVCVVAFFSAPGARAEAEHDYVGVKKCSMCHKNPAKGDQFAKWQNSKHAKAYETLGTEESKTAASKLGVTDPQKSGKCLKCHSTAFGHGETQVTKVLPVEEGVSCESCHGAGKDYMKMSVMKDVNAAKDAGLVLPEEAICKKCHNEENPFNKPFNYQERFEKIKHPNPAK